MEFITNEYLRALTEDTDKDTINFYDELKESGKNDPSTIDFVSKSSKAYLYKIFEEDFEKLLDNATDEKEVKLLHKYASRFFLYRSLREGGDKKIKDELKICKDVLSSGLCHRTPALQELIIKEQEKLTNALDSDFVSIAINEFRDLYSSLFPDLSEANKAIKISETLNALGIYKQKPFRTIEEANDLAYKRGEEKESYFQEGKDIIYDGLKKYFKKDKR